MNIHAVVYTAEGVERYDDLDPAISTPSETWLHADVTELVDSEALIDGFGIHQLAVEDVLHDETRPKTEEYESHTFVLMKTARLSRRDEIEFRKEVRTTPVGFFIGEDWLVTLSSPDIETVDPMPPEWDRSAHRYADRGTDFSAYRIMDGIVDDYFDLLDEIEDDIEAVEERVLDEPDPQMLEDLNAVRRDLLAFRKVAWPAREAMSYLSRGDLPQVDDANEKYFRGVYDHLVQVVDLIETYRDLTSGSRDIYLNVVSQSTNEVMKTLTVVPRSSSP